MPITTTADRVLLQEGGLLAAVPRDSIMIAHMGCMLLGKVYDKARPLPEEVVVWFADRLGPSWRKTVNATGRLGDALAAAARASGMTGLALVDTMRNGSDAWRPGAFLTAAVQHARNGYPGLRVAYAREDELCPPAELLKAFMREGSDMPFGEYAARYAEHLRGGATAAAATMVLRSLAEGRLPVFYCTDPYIPGYADVADFGSRKPYRERQYEPALRPWGCHRFILVEEVVRFFAERGAQVEVFEVDQGSPSPHRRCCRPIAL